jgi:hypothetical protein
MNTARASQKRHPHKRPPASECFFMTKPHPSQRWYSEKNGRGDTKTNKVVASFVDFEEINQYKIGIDASHQVITANEFCLQHGELTADGNFSIRTCVFGAKACSTIDDHVESGTAKRTRDASPSNHSLSAAKRQLHFDTSPSGNNVNIDENDVIGETWNNFWLCKKYIHLTCYL